MGVVPFSRENPTEASVLWLWCPSSMSYGLVFVHFVWGVFQPLEEKFIVSPTAVADCRNRSSWCTFPAMGIRPAVSRPRPTCATPSSSSTLFHRSDADKQNSDSPVTTVSNQTKLRQKLRSKRCHGLYSQAKWLLHLHKTNACSNSSVILARCGLISRPLCEKSEFDRCQTSWCTQHPLKRRLQSRKFLLADTF